MRSALKAAGGVVVALLVSACQPNSWWEAPQTCRGSEETRVRVDGAPLDQMAVHTTPLAVDLQLRPDHVQLKSMSLPVVSSSDGWVHFASHSPAFWVAGQYHAASGQLSLVSERVLSVNGANQHITSTGRFVCPVT